MTLPRPRRTTRAIANTCSKRFYIALPVAGNERDDRCFGIARREDQRLDDRARFDTERRRRLFGASGSIVKRDHTVAMTCRLETGGDMPNGWMGQEMLAHRNPGPRDRQA